MAVVKYEIVKNIGVLSKAGFGWAKELNLIDWIEREPKYDLSDWSPDHEQMTKELRTFTVQTGIATLAFSPDGNRLNTTSDDDGVAFAWDVGTGKSWFSFDGKLALSPAQLVRMAHISRPVSLIRV